MAEIISKDELKELMENKGEMRGNGPKSMGEIVLKLKGEEGLKKLEETITELGYPIKFKKINSLKFYPVWLAPLILLAANRLFGFSDNEFRQMGESDVKFSPLSRIFIKYFISIDTVIKNASKVWRNYHTVGDLKVTEFDKEKRYAVLRIENWRLNHFHCQYLIGYFSAVIKLIVQSKAEITEIKCPFFGDDYHEFSIKW